MVFSTADTEPPALNIEAKNLAFESNLYIVYYVSYENVDAKDVKLLVRDEPQASYTYGTQAAILSAKGCTTYKDKTCPLFAYQDLKARNMTDDVYVRAYTASGDCLVVAVIKYQSHGGSSFTLSGEYMQDVYVTVTE